MHTDIPTRAQIKSLLGHRSPASVSIYLPTSRLTQAAESDRVVLTNLLRDAIDQLRSSGTAESDIDRITEGVEALAEDDEFWARQADSLAVFADPDHVWSFRLPNNLTESVEVSDRFHVKPLLRTVTFPQAAYVLALAKGAVRLLEIGPDGPPQEVDVPELPRDAWDPRGNHVVRARERNYVRQIDHALRGVLNGSDLPLILAATETIDALYRTVNTYPQLADVRWPGNPEEATDAELAADARSLLDELYAAQLAGHAVGFDVLRSQGRTATDISDLARLATIGAVDTLYVDIDASSPGTIDETTGAIDFANEADAESYGLLDEIARRVYRTGGRVLAVRSADVPGGATAAATLRYVI